MAGKTFALTTRTNSFRGTAGDDTFNALANKKGKATLTDTDMLNGRGGVDTVKAFIAADTLTPNLKNIETAIFTRTAANDLTLDLAKSARLDTITFDKFASGVSVINASSLATLAVNAMAAGKAINLAGIDATKVTNFSASLTGSNIDLSIAAKDAGKFATISLALDASSARFVAPLATDALTVTATGTSELKGSAGWLSAKTLVAKGAGNLVADLGAAAALTGFDGSAATGDITLTLGGAALTSLKTGSGKDVVTFSGKTAAGGTLAVDLGAGDNGLKGSAADWLGAKTLTLTGAGKLTADLGSASALTSLDASAMTGDLTVTLGGAAVTSLKTGAGNDVVTVSGSFNALGVVTVALGAGSDKLDLSGAIIGAGGLNLAGGTGSDEVILAKSLTAIPTVVSGFEKVSIKNAAGRYDFDNSGSALLSLAGASGDTILSGLVNGGIVTFTGSFDNGLQIGSQPSAILKILAGCSQIGQAGAGLSMVSGTSLNIEVDAAGAGSTLVLYLDDLGTTDTLKFSTARDVILKSSNAPSGGIKSIEFGGIGASLDMSNLNSAALLSSAGVYVLCGTGNDILVGGTGKDTLTVGGGNNTVTGGLGADTTNLLLQGSMDTIIFRTANESNGNNRDKVTAFTADDVIDVSKFAAGLKYDGSVADFQSGVNKLVAGETHGFFDQAEAVFHIDSNANGAIDATDFALELAGLAQLNASQIDSIPDLIF